jgi:Fic family protein
MINYVEPPRWMLYDERAVAESLVEAKASVMSAIKIPYQRSWVEGLRKIQLKREISGTSKIEGADFTDRELEVALEEEEQPSRAALTRSQRQARGAMRAYRWIAQIPDDQPINGDLIRRLHFAIVKDADDDHCPPGQLRERDQNVHFGSPRHRGADGGDECERMFEKLCYAVQHEFRGNDPLVQAVAAHYHFAAIHPFLDGNGRTARALASILLQRAGLRDVCFIPLSNYYYDEKAKYLSTLSEVRANSHDLTPFLIFSLKGIALQCQRLTSEIQVYLSKALFRNLMHDLFTRLQSPRKRVILDRQLEILEALLEGSGTVEIWKLFARIERLYSDKTNPKRVYIRDLNGLVALNAIWAKKLVPNSYEANIRLEWPTEMTETEFFQKIKAMPKSKTLGFLSGG